MQRELLIMRHAKSDWDNPMLTDFERTLNNRGRKAAPRMGQWLKEQGLTPDWVVSSPAVRTRQTVQLVCGELGITDAANHWEQGIYEASLPTLLQVLADCPSTAQRVLLVGHNPGLEQLVKHLAESFPDIPPLNIMPTAALAHFQLPADWQTLNAGCGQLIKLQHVRALDS